MPASNATFFGERDARAAPARAASTSRSPASGRCGTSPTAPCGPGGRRLRRLRGPRLGRRAADGAARRRPGRRRDGPGRGASPTRARTRSTSCPRAPCRRATCTSSTPCDGDDRPVSLVHEDSDAAAPDGGLRRGRQQRRPQGRSRAGRCPTATGTASTTACPSTSTTSCAPCCGAGPTSRCTRRRGRRWPRAGEQLAAGSSDLRPRSASCSRRDEVEAPPCGAASCCCAATRMPLPSRGVARRSRGRPSESAPVRLRACVRGRAPRCPG